MPHAFPRENTITVQAAGDIAHFLDRLSPTDLRNLVFVVDLEWTPAAAEWDLTREVHPLRPVELMLSFPEVYWIFLTPSLPDLSDAFASRRSTPPELSNGAFQQQLRSLAIPAHFVEYEKLALLPQLIQRHGEGFRPLFDPFGLRFFIEAMAQPDMAKAPASSSQFLLPQLGVAVEDESTFCWFHGYLLYRYGRFASLAPTYSALRTWQKLLSSALDEIEGNGRSVHPTGSAAGATVERPTKIAIIEDVELSFSDCKDWILRKESLMPGHYEATTHLYRDHSTALRLRWDEGQWSGRWAPRIVVSSIKVSCDGRAILKPHNGMFEIGIVESLWSPPKDRPNSPPTECLRFRTDGAPPSAADRHSATGMVQEVAARLLMRIRAGAEDVRDSDQAIHYAALALAARRLLGFRTLHLSLDAIRLQHQMEVEAEASFIGTSNDLDVDLRMRVIEDEVTDIVWRCIDGFEGPWSRRWRMARSLILAGGLSNRQIRTRIRNLVWGPGTEAAPLRPEDKEPKRKRQLINAMLETSSSLRDVYHKHDQIDDENDLVRHFLYWQNRPYRRPETRDVLKWTLSWPLGYLNILRGSLRGLLFTSLCWVILFAALFANFAAPSPSLSLTVPIGSWGRGAYWVAHSGGVFIGMQQFLEGGSVPGDMKDEILALEQWRNEPVEFPAVRMARERMAAEYITDLRARLSRWWTLYVCEISLGYIHLAVFIAQLAQRLSRR